MSYSRKSTYRRTENKTSEQSQQPVLPPEEINCKDEEENSTTTIETTAYVCVNCQTTECIMWRKLNNELICNLCHLKRVKNSSQNGMNSRNNTQNNKTREVQVVRMSKRKNKTNKKFVNGFYAERIVKNGNSKNRRTIFKKKPMKSIEGVAKILASSSIYYNGILFQVGDVVCTSDVEGGTYYAQIRGFLQDDYCEKSVVITWLIPKIPNPTHFDPMLFVPALDEDTPRPMECFDFVCRATTDLLKSRILHTPYLRSQSNLYCLVQAAAEIGNENLTDTDEKESEVDGDASHLVNGEVHSCNET